jgi:hypothetical protein
VTEIFQKYTSLFGGKKNLKQELRLFSAKETKKNLEMTVGLTKTLNCALKLTTATNRFATIRWLNEFEIDFRQRSTKAFFFV